MTYDFYKDEWVSSQEDVDQGFPVEELTQEGTIRYEWWGPEGKPARIHMILGMRRWDYDEGRHTYRELFFPDNRHGIETVRNLAAAMNRMADEVEKELADAR